ncbi:NmrA family NAD(P)-binding protein [Kitasatospora sp. NPDC006697]|uniref:NmrA family NAD(P)-binding protein n=1 Tax=Kitasatospora sp. NPDC006697 TaxID=3364020 RepID=UPI0036AE1703
MTTAVLGATGGQGSAVVDALLRRGEAVRAVVRDAGAPRARALAARGVEVVTGDLLDRESLAAAFRGVRAAFAVTTPFERGPAQEVAQGEAIVAAARAAGLPFLVLASVASADRHTGIPHFESKARIEAVLADSGLPSAVVAPTYFYDNVLGSAVDIADGVMPLAVPADKPLQQVARADLGEVAATVLTAPGHWTGRRIEVAGDEPTPAQMAEAIARAARRPVRHLPVPVEQVLAHNPDLGAMFGYLSDTGYAVDLPALRAEFPGLSWTSYQQWADGVAWPG